MNINRRHIRVAAFAGATALLLQIAHTSADGRHQQDKPLEITFTKWITPPPVVVPGTANIPEARLLMAGLVDGDVPGGTYVGEVLQRQQSVNPALKAGIAKLEAIYEVHDANGDHNFTALIRGGTNQTTGAALLDGVVLAGQRTGAPVHVEFQTITGIPGVIGCVGAPAGATCFEGTIYVGPAPKGDD